MGLFSKLFGKKEAAPTFTNEELVEAGACPNCWGRQDYEGKYVQFVKDQTKSNINHDKEHRKAFVQQFVETHVTGIQLKQEGNHRVCATCKTEY